MALIAFAAAVLGDQVGYWFGKKVGPSLFDRPKSRIFNPANVVKAQAFFDKYGSKTIVLARFVPIVRTFAPIVAGVGRMKYRTFVIYNVIGGVLWIGSLTYAGYFFGNIPWVKSNLSLIVVAIVVVSLIPAVVTFARERGRPHE